MKCATKKPSPRQTQILRRMNKGPFSYVIVKGSSAIVWYQWFVTTTGVSKTKQERVSLAVINRMIKAGWLKKNWTGMYRLTDKGREVR